MPFLCTLPAEVLHLILRYLDPCDLAAVNSSCQDLNSYLKDNELLYKELYLNNWDKPGQEEVESDLSWQDELENNTRLKKILTSSSSESYDLHRKELPFICKTVLSHLSTAQADSESSKNVEYLCELFPESLISSPLLTSSSLYALSNPDGPGADNTPEERQLTAKLHVYYGVPCTTDNSPASNMIHPYARSRVYDLRKYTDNTSWGPFLDDTSQGVDWEKVEAIMIVLHYNLTFVSMREGGKFPLPMWEKPFLGVTPYSFVAQPRLCPHMPAPPQSAPSLTGLLFSTPNSNPIDSESDEEADTYTTRILSRCPTLPSTQRDPFSITGTWLRVVCFLDYSELFQFNFGLDAEHHYTLEEKLDMPPLDTEEAVRMIVMRLKVTKIRPPNLDSEDGECDYKGWPVVEFKGTSRSLHSSWDPNANSFIRGIRGTVRMTPHGEVRWTTYSVFQGEERWKSEGIQVGGPGSARGVIGNWFEKDYDTHGPAGPTAFWKYSDDASEKGIPRFRGM